LSDNTSGDDPLSLALSLALNDPELRKIVAAWATLPPAIKVAILALVASNETGKGA
jgi:hypothetical protein